MSKIPLSDLPNNPYPEREFSSAIYTMESFCVLRSRKISLVLRFPQDKNQPPTPHRLGRVLKTCTKNKINYHPLGKTIKMVKSSKPTKIE